MVDWIAESYLDYVHTTSHTPRTKSLKSHLKSAAPSTNPSFQQDNVSRKFFLNLVNNGIQYAYDVRHDKSPQVHKKTDHPAEVIIVGGGCAGLAAAYELAQSGHHVTILEATNRVGGRVKTIRDFADGLHEEGGAMRLPGFGPFEDFSTKPVHDWDGGIHYLTDFYIKQFQLATRPFNQEDPNNNTFFQFYGQKPIKQSEVTKDWYDKLWPGWDAKIPAKYKDPNDKTNFIDSPGTYWGKSIKPVEEQLINKLQPNPQKLPEIAASNAKIWDEWATKWSAYSGNDFLRAADEFDKENPLRPWPEEAIRAFAVSGYTPLLDVSLVELLRDDLGAWWETPMHTIEGGMDVLPNAFTKKNVHGWNQEVNLGQNIRYGQEVVKINYQQDGKVHVFTREKGETAFVGDYVIITVPLVILRQIEINLPVKVQQAVQDLTYEPSTKVLLQCKERFWETKYKIKGGWSKTNNLISQIHYPSPNKIETQRGVLVCYTWNQEALTFAAQNPEQRIQTALREVAKIHPEIYDYFEVGASEAWNTENFEQCAFALLQPHQYLGSLKTLLNPSTDPIYLAGEAISFSNGWIQGALWSGLKAAYELYAHNENKYQRT